MQRGRLDTPQLALCQSFAQCFSKFGLRLGCAQCARNVTDENYEFRCWKQLRLRIREGEGKFTLTCTSAAAELVFSLVEAMFGTEQLSLLAHRANAALHVHTILQTTSSIMGKVE